MKKIWNDPVWSKVISAAIIAVATLSVTYFLNLWPSISRHIYQSVAFLVAPSLILNWIIGLLILLALPTSVVIVITLWKVVFPAKEIAPHWQTYTSDTFFGLRWRWQWGYLDDNFINLNTFCPHCDFQVFPEDASEYRAIDRISFYCECCNTKLGTFDEPFVSLKNKTSRFIQQKLRNETWHEGNPNIIDS